MPSVEELLSQTSEDETNLETYADSGIEYCTVDDDTRLVTIPDKYKKLGVESDEKVKRIWFRFPKLVGNNGVDLSAIGVRVNYRNANGDGDIYIVEDLTTDGDYVTFSWELTRKVTAYKGNVSFVVCAVKSATDGTIKNEWNTTLNKECEVLEGLEVTEQIAQENPDIIEYILANLGGSVSAEQIAQAVEEYMIAHPFIETDPTVSDWAKQPEKPSYTAEEVGADASGTAVAKVSEHNTASNAHNDIRLLVQGLTERLNALADSDDTTLDQMSEVVAYIKSNKSLIDAITTSKVNVSDIIDNLTTNVSNKPLSASQGVALKALIDAIVVPTKLSELENDSGYAKTTDIPDNLPNPKKLTFTGAVIGSYDGSEEVSIEIPSSGGSGSGSDYTLPIANPNRLGGVMPVAKTETMTHPVGVDEIGRLFVESSECNEGWVKVAEIQTTEDLNSLSITEDMDGNPLSFCEAIISVIISRASDATSNGEFVMSVCPEWKNSFNNKGIYGLALLSDVYWYVGHFKKMNNLLIEQIISKKRIGDSLDLVTTWAENLPMALATGSVNGMISGVKNFNKNYYGNFLNSENKFQGVTIGTDLATSVKIGSGTRLEVWVR